MGRAIRSRFVSEITVAYDLIACLCAGAAVNATNYALSNFDRVEFGGKEDSLTHRIKQWITRQFNCATHYAGFHVTHIKLVRDICRLLNCQAIGISVLKEPNDRSTKETCVIIVCIHMYIY